MSYSRLKKRKHSEQMFVLLELVKASITAQINVRNVSKLITLTIVERNSSCTVYATNINHTSNLKLEERCSTSEQMSKFHLADDKMDKKCTCSLK